MATGLRAVPVLAVRCDHRTVLQERWPPIRLIALLDGDRTSDHDPALAAGHLHGSSPTSSPP
jgi:hypothetical protein